jgi:hypothetical protein
MIEPEPDYTLWRAARSHAELCGLMAGWLEGTVPFNPAYLGPPEEETTELIPLLAWANRQGFLTTQSQPGVYVPHRGKQRAFVNGMCSRELLDDMLEWLHPLADDGELIVDVAGPDDDGLPWLTVTRSLRRRFLPFPGRATTWNGAGEPVEEMAMLDDCHPDAAVALRSAWRVMIADPVWGRNSVLWPALAASLSLNPIHHHGG